MAWSRRFNFALDASPLSLRFSLLGGQNESFMDSFVSGSGALACGFFTTCVPALEALAALWGFCRR